MMWPQYQSLAWYQDVTTSPLLVFIQIFVRPGSLVQTSWGSSWLHSVDIVFIEEACHAVGWWRQ